ncbi:hypothetical protein C8F01DRAFT_1351701 [Mycena amicta]|nr:hypothetical protein C8F01DRAFT_1351701 [Mycena amicta]
MKFFSLSVAVVLQLAIGTEIVHAAAPAPAPTPDSGVSVNGLVISHIVPVGEYNMTYWIAAPGTVAAARELSAKACGTNDVACSTIAIASTPICSQLVNSLNTGTSIANSPRSICLGQSNNQCCVSWSQAVGTMPESDLFNAARDTFGQCWNADFGSGLARNVLLNGVCVTQCLSNRPNGCS